MTQTPSCPRVLTIAGTDPTGGAGAQADIKSISAAGGFAYSVTTALVAQNTQGVTDVFTPPTTFLTEQLDAVSSDVDIDAVKVGMLGDTATIKAVSSFLASLDDTPIVVDPVMVATSGDRLLHQEAEEALAAFIEHATVVTPNIPELAILAHEKPATSFEEACKQAAHLAADKNVVVIVKGGHLTGSDAGNTVVFPDGTSTHVPAVRIDTTTTHGTGCSLSSALATRLAAGDDAVSAMRWVTDWLSESIAGGKGLLIGHGHGPVDHFHRARRLEAAADSTPWSEATIPIARSNDPTQWLEASKVSAPTPHVPPAGPWTQALWNATGDLWDKIMNLPFIKGLEQGNLARRKFLFYLDQDAYYLDEYSRTLSQLSVTAPDLADRMAWAADAQGCGIAEKELHDSYLHDLSRAQAPSPVTYAYTNFLTATVATDDYAVGAAAVLPCYWLYMEIGLSIGTDVPDSHPYKAWLDEYSSPEFTDLTAACIKRVERGLAEASPETRQRAARAYLLASRHELEFFSQADRALTLHRSE